VEVYPHGDVDALEQLLRRSPGRRRRLIVTDSLFSMEGDLAPLGPLSDLAERYDAMLLVDEAHATGVFGRQGRGVAEHLGVEESVHIKVGTLSKALGSAGGFVAGSRALIDWLANRARSYMFSTAPPAAAAAAALAALRMVREEPQRRAQLLGRAARLRDRLREQGWWLGGSQSQIAPIVVGDPRPAMKLSAELRRRGLFAPGIRPPAAPEGQSLVRISLSYAHSDELLERLAAALAEIRGGWGGGGQKE
jgi:7-keto-8-aminopelargonate synthetase-like enzyme